MRSQCLADAKASKTKGGCLACETFGAQGEKSDVESLHTPRMKKGPEGAARRKLPIDGRNGVAKKTAQTMLRQQVPDYQAGNWRKKKSLHL